MKIALTDKALSALKPQPSRYEIQDIYCPGLSIRVTPEGRKTFNVKYRYGLKQSGCRSGSIRACLSSKRVAERWRLCGMLMKDRTPLSVAANPEFRVEAVVTEFIQRYAKPRNRKWMESERILWRELVAVHGQRDIREIKREHILEIMDGAVDRGAHYQANRILANVRKLFNWCLERGIVEANPTIGIKAPTKEVARDRKLSVAEIGSLLRACRNDVYPFRQFVPLLLATAQRRGELANMRWSEIDYIEKTWIIPAERSKNGKAHYVPLSDYALERLSEVPRFLDCDFVFTTTRRSPVSGFSKALRRLWQATGADDWRYHDLRRTAASGMAKARVQPHVIEKVLNHITGQVSGVALTYNRYQYETEMREALEGWGAYLANFSRESAETSEI